MTHERHEFARALHKRQTRAEDLLWERLRGTRFHGAKFRRQVPFDRFVVDFYHSHARRSSSSSSTANSTSGSPTTTSRGPGYSRAACSCSVVRFTTDMRKVCDELRFSVLSRICAARCDCLSSEAGPLTFGSLLLREGGDVVGTVRVASSRFHGLRLPARRLLDLSHKPQPLLRRLARSYVLLLQVQSKRLVAAINGNSGCSRRCSCPGEMATLAVDDLRETIGGHAQLES